MRFSFACCHRFFFIIFWNQLCSKADMFHYFFLSFLVRKEKHTLIMFLIFYSFHQTDYRRHLRTDIYLALVRHRAHAFFALFFSLWLLIVFDISLSCFIRRKKRMRESEEKNYYRSFNDNRPFINLHTRATTIAHSMCECRKVLTHKCVLSFVVVITSSYRFFFFVFFFFFFCCCLNIKVANERW